MTTKLRKQDDQKAAVVIEDVKPVNVEPTKLEGAKLVLASAKIPYEKAGYSDTMCIEIADSIRKVKFDESQENRKAKYLSVKSNVKSDMLKLVDSIGNKRELAVESAGSSPAGSIGSCSVVLSDGRKIAARITALRLDPDNEKLKELKTTKDLMANKIKNVITSAGLGKIADLLGFEAGTRDNKTISLFSTDVKKDDCIQDDEFKYQVSVSLVPEVEDCK